MNDVLVPDIWPDTDVLRVCVLFLIGISCVDNLGLHIGETGASCYTFHSNSIFHENMQARVFFWT